jgi:hypothetical protein
MEFLFAGILTCFKVAIQSSIYAAIVLFLARTIGIYRPDSLVDRVSHSQKRFWRNLCFFFAAGLIWQYNTYWGEHGLGDSARIPLGYGEAIEEINNMDAYFEPIGKFPGERDMYGPLLIDRFQVDADILCLKLLNNTYCVYDLRLKIFVLLNNAEKYNNYARQHNLSRADELQSFRQQYGKYWSGWRFWLLA